MRFLFIIFFVYGCSIKDNGKQSDSARNGEYTMEESTTIKFMLDESTGFNHYSINLFSKDSSDYFSLVNSNDNSIIIYHLDSAQIFRKIVLNTEGPDGVGKLDFVHHFLTSLDSIYIYSINSGKLYLVSSQGKVIDTHKMVDFENTKLSSAFPQPSNWAPIVKIDNMLYIPCGIHTRLTDYSNYKTILAYNLKTRASVYLTPLPQVYSSGYWGAPFKYLPSLAPSHDPSQLIISYPIKNSLSKIDARDGHVLEEIPVDSKFFAKISPMDDDITFGTKNDINSYYERENEYNFSSSDFSALRYDSHQRLYFRMSFLRPSLDSVKMGFRIPDFSLIILNETLDKIGEVRFEGSKYSSSMHFIRRDGYYIARRDMYENNENEIAFSRFKIISKKINNGK